MMVVELGPSLPFSNVVVSYLNNRFTIEVDDADCMYISVDGVSDAEFSVSKILQRSLPPVWVASPDEHLLQSMLTLHLPVLTSSVTCAKLFSIRFAGLQLTLLSVAPSRLSKCEVICAIVALFSWYRHALQELSFMDLFQHCTEYLSVRIQSKLWCSRSILTSGCYEAAFSSVVASVLRVPFSPRLIYDTATEGCLRI